MEQYFLELAEKFKDPVTAAAQLLGFIPILLGYFIFHSNNRKTSITVKAVSDLVSAMHFLLLRKWTGFSINCVNTVRGVCFSCRDIHPWASGVWMPILFCGATVAGSCLGWTGPESMLPLVGSCLAVLGYWSREPRTLRRFNFVGIALWTVYGVLSFSVPTVVGNVISMFSIIQTELRVMRTTRRKNND